MPDVSGRLPFHSAVGASERLSDLLNTTQRIREEAGLQQGHLTPEPSSSHETQEVLRGLGPGGVQMTNAVIPVVVVVGEKLPFLPVIFLKFVFNIVCDFWAICKNVSCCLKCCVIANTPGYSGLWPRSSNLQLWALEACDVGF